MKERILIFLALLFLIIILVGLNAASFVQKEKVPDTEANPNRSTYNYGATGTRAFYDLLAETGRRPTRWQEPIDALLNGKNKPSTFVIVGKTRREFEDKEIEQLFRWVSAGGKLVIIDREPPEKLMKTTANWLISIEKSKEKFFAEVDPSDPKQMTEKTTAAKPTQPTVYTEKVNAVQASRFASTVNFEHIAGENFPVVEDKNIKQTGETARKNEIITSENPPPKSAEESSGEDFPEDVESPALAAPFVHLASADKNLLIDFPYGAGEIVYLTDPYIVSNGGINLVDNAQLAVNIVASGDGTVAFDEYHQGYGAENNQILRYFAGTPVIPIFLQLLILIGLIFYSQSRRFARALPENEPNRLSKLEYVSAMAELQRRTRAFDLAIENIYTEFRRQTARLVGVDNSTASYKDLARLIAERAGLDSAEVENLMFKCEDIIRGEPTGKKEILEITSRIRQIEEKLNLKRTRKQSFRK